MKKVERVVESVVVVEKEPERKKSIKRKGNLKLVVDIITQKDKKNNRKLET